MTAPTHRRRFRAILRPFRRSRRLVLAPTLGDADVEKVVEAVDDVLGRREATSRRVAAARIVDAYTSLEAPGRRRFLEILADSFAADADALDRAVDRMRVARDPAARAEAERELRRAVVPRYAAFLHAVTGLPQGVAFLVELRADLLTVPHRRGALGQLDDELTGHLSTLFDVGLLDLRQITWDSPASVLERLMTTEAVHAIDDWESLRHRLDGDQRCYAFFHPALPREPIVFVEVALTHGLAGNLAELLERDDAVDEPDTAIFYSITSAQPGLAGVHLGNELIKQVVDALRREDDHLKTFATLSPIPGFRRWLLEQLDATALTPAEVSSLGDDARAVVELADRSWLDDERADRLRTGLSSAAARYLTTVHRGRAVDPVANFHLANGASLERLQWLANPAPYGLEESLGLMVNYRYDRAHIERNARAYLADGTIDSSSAVRSLIKSVKR